MKHILKRIILLSIFTLFSSNVLASELPFGGQTLSFPDSTKIQPLGRTSSANDPLLLKKPDPDNRSDYQKLRDTFENLERAGDVQYYQLVATTEKGIHQAFFITVKIPQKNFYPDQWSPLFPDNTAKTTFLGDYINDLDERLIKSAGQPIEIETDLSEKFYLFHYKKPSGFFVKNQEILSSSGSILIDTTPEYGTRALDTQAFYIPLYFHHFAWQYQNDYYLCLLISADGEKSFWKSLPQPFNQNN